MSRTQTLDREVGRALPALSAAAKRGLGDPAPAELVMIRASQINHCAFCLDMHLRPARENGECEERIALLDAWEEAGDRYSGRERAAPALTEAVTVLTDGFVPDAVYDTAAKHFDQGELARLIGLVAVVNGWSRLMVGRRILPGGYRP
ncbi:carboxymuconolactone decarboxylase family protein [Streptomyces collinus]|uniref:carboxymuconolactone decarboxylase family protein n=1 Tax=Streptomyces collinus TaxID=42684 RepID=UPI0029425BEB|nr:carboxymuconolactone decarboxylase family protein [Streptomyces collinus]